MRHLANAQYWDRPAGGNTGRLFLAFGGPVCADRFSNCPLDRVLTYKNLIYLLNLQISVFNGRVTGLGYIKVYTNLIFVSCHVFRTVLSELYQMHVDMPELLATNISTYQLNLAAFKTVINIVTCQLNIVAFKTVSLA